MRGLILLAAAISLTGCAGPTWYHSGIADPARAERQFVVDDAACTALAYEAVEVPQVVQNHGKPQGGAAAFAQGFINGQNQAAAGKAKKAREKVFRGCMYERGWSDSPVNPALSQERGEEAGRYPDEPAAIWEIEVYGSPEQRWAASVQEFLGIYSIYRQSPEAYERLDQKVRELGTLYPELAGPRVLIGAHDFLVGEGIAQEPEGDLKSMTLFYRPAAEGDVASWNALSAAYVLGLGPFEPDRKRALYWAQQSALAGEIKGKREFGLLLYKWGDTESNRRFGFKLLSELAESGDEDASTLLSTLARE